MICLITEAQNGLKGREINKYRHTILRCGLGVNRERRVKSPWRRSVRCYPGHRWGALTFVTLLSLIHEVVIRLNKVAKRHQLIYAINVPMGGDRDSKLPHSSKPSSPPL